MCLLLIGVLQDWLSLEVVVDWGDGTHMIGSAQLLLTKAAAEWSASVVTVSIQQMPEYIFGSLCQSTAVKQALLEALTAHNPQLQQAAAQVSNSA